MSKEQGVTPTGSGHSAQPEPVPVSAVPASVPNALGLTDVLQFGKYQGLSVRAIIRFNPSYLAWAVKNLDRFDLDAEARRVTQRAINAEREATYQRQQGWAWGFGAGAKAAAERRRKQMAQIEFEERHAAAQAMSARQGQDPQGLEAKPASAVGNADAPDLGEA